MLTQQEIKFLADRAIAICNKQVTVRAVEDEVSDMLGMYLRFSGGRPDIAAGYKAKFVVALETWRATRGW